MRNSDTVLVGIDGGATKVSGWTISFDNKKNLFSLGEHNSQTAYSEIEGFLPGFRPESIPIQLEQQANNSIQISGEEHQQGQAILEACQQVIVSLAVKAGAKQLLIGIGMPGLKTSDRRGISVLANGPRMVDFSDKLEERLKSKGISLLKSIGHLGSDADYCGIGENYAEDGLLKDVQTGYFLGGGTGVADALKINDNLVPFDEAKPWIAKTWEMKSPDGRSMERFTSMGGLQAVYGDIAGIQVEELNKRGIYPMQIVELASKGDKNAKQLVKIAIENLSMLIFERIVTLYAGSSNLIQFVSDKREKLIKDHPFLTGLFDRIIIGQRLGELFESKHGFELLQKPVVKEINRMIQGSDQLDQRAKDHYRELENIIQCSKLREAPAIGAGVDAYLHF